MANDTYRPEDFGKKEEELYRRFIFQRDDSLRYFQSCIKPRLDRSYKLYIAFNGDRARKVEKWQSNVFVPYTQAVVETLVPRIIDARPEFTVQGRNEDDQLKATKVQQILDYTWEIAKMDDTTELLTRSSLIYGTGYLQVSWKKDEREHKFLSSKDITSKKLKWDKRKQTFYDAPNCEWVDNYSLLYDWHNIARESKQYWFKRLILTGAEIKRRYPMADAKRLKLAFARPGQGDLEDYGNIRNEVKLVHEDPIKGEDHNVNTSGINSDRYKNVEDLDMKMYEVFEATWPFKDEYSVFVSEVPILKGGSIPIPYNFKEAPFIEVPYLRLPNEFEGYGIPMILESPQIMLNMMKNQRLDATTLNIHKMWIVNPLANITKDELVTRPFGIIYSVDPNGVKEIQFSDIKASAFKEEELLKADMRYASGVDDSSMGVGGAAGSATEVRHLRESTLERVRLFVNHLGSAYSDVLRYWVTMYNQFFTDDMVIRIIGDDGQEAFPLIEKDDLDGMFDFKATVIPSIAGQNEVKKKQDMDLFQLLVTLPFIDQQKLTGKLLHDWSWALESVAKGADQQAPPGMEGMMPPGAEGQMPPGAEGQMPPGMEGMMPPGMAPQAGPPQFGGMPPRAKGVSPQVSAKVMAMLGGKGKSPLRELAMPVDLTQAGPPPTVKGAPKGGSGGKGGPGPSGANTRGMNRGGQVNTNVSQRNNASVESSLLNRSFNIQK